MTEDIPDILKPEPKEHYDANAAGFFRNVGDAQRPGLSADEAAVTNRALPSDAETAKYADHVDLAVNKTRRSGAIVDHKKVGHGGIFMQSMSETSALIDEFTAGKYKPAEPMKPKPTQEKPTGHAPKATAIMDKCPSCMQPVDPAAYSLGMIIADEQDSLKLFARGLKYGDLVLYCLCLPCNEKAKQLAEEAYPLVLVEGGELVPDNEVQYAIKHNRQVNLHTGAERTAAQLRLRDHAIEVTENIWRYLEIENTKPDSPVFLRHRKGGN